MGFINLPRKLSILSEVAGKSVVLKIDPGKLFRHQLKESDFKFHNHFLDECTQNSIAENDNLYKELLFLINVLFHTE